MTERGAALNAFLREGAGRPFSFLECDCTTWVADWVARVRGVDPARGWRGTYSTALASARIVRRGGGLAALVAGPLAESGLTETDTPKAGDVGVVETPVGELAAVCTGDRWAMKTKDGIVVAPARMIKAWSI